MDFDTWLQQKGITGRVPRQAAIKLQDQWMKDTKGGASFTPTAIAVTNPVNTNQVIPVLTTSPNSVQPLPQTQFKPAVGKDGKAYNYNPMTGTYAPALIEGTTNQFEADPKSNRMAEMLAAMAGPQGAAPAESGGFLSGLFGGGAPVTNAPTPTYSDGDARGDSDAGHDRMRRLPVAAPTPMGETFTREQYRQMTGQDLPPGEYDDAQGRPFLIR
jgi:hypothetical protein